MGWAELCRIIISFIASRKSLFVLENRADILLSAINALITLKPPNVSSNWDIISPHCACAVEDCLFSFRLTTPIIQPVRGKIKITKASFANLPKQSDKTNQKSDRITDKHIDGTGQRVLHHRNIRTHTGYDISFTFF